MTFDDALTRYRKVGASKANDAELMAGFCAYTLQTVVGAVSPKLVWEGAQKQGLACRDLAALCVKDIMAVSDLQWL